MYSPLERLRAGSIPQDVQELIKSIYARYLNFNLGNDTSENLSEQKHLQGMIEYINDDNDMLRFNAISLIGSLIVIRQALTIMGTGSGLNVCFGPQGLYIYDWDDFARRRKEIPLTCIDTLDEIGIRLTAEELRNAIVDFFRNKRYMNRIANFNAFRNHRV